MVSGQMLLLASRFWKLLLCGKVYPAGLGTDGARASMQEHRSKVVEHTHSCLLDASFKPSQLPNRESFWFFELQVWFKRDQELSSSTA